MTALAWRLKLISFVENCLAAAIPMVVLSSALWAQFPQSSNPSAPDANAPNTKEHHDQMSSKDVQEKLGKALDSKNAPYAGSDIKVRADDQTITLLGTVQSSMQIEMAKQLAEAYAGNRKVVSELTIH